MFKMILPVLGMRTIRPDPNYPGGFLWFDSFGWHNCTPRENEFIRNNLR